ncbi:hypothetical protein CDO73_11700 [Saccharibacillus sp. O23]|uniref:helix-turn-helix domain-containing protein n=1 Tax=Saccharibacillus sp. O23 TaxID=2009338 RepID=UPI000B4E52C2|nr:helix-turn-helix transcriptional regulator [Saccharibacillus sp. O23]OWR30564.1 hypothetical protein CDO73_11700 [Saccharibacillus sp. O23]
MFIVNLGENLKRLRKLNHLTQEEIAERLDVTKQAVYKWENNTCYPDIENLIKVSQLYNVKLDDLLNNEVKEAEKAEFFF